MKAIWKGTLSFGLVSIFVKLYSAIESQALGFRLLHAKCKTPLNYKRWCPKCKKAIEWEDVVKGMPMADGSFFVITKEKLEKLKPEKSDRIEIVEFVDAPSISPIYYDAHYYVAPMKVTDKAYFLFIKALQKMKKIAIGKFVLREKEYMCALQPYENGLLLSTLNYQYEIRPITRIEELKVAVSPRISANELKLAEELISKLTKKTFDMSQFKDTFAQQLKKQIKRGGATKAALKKRARKAVKEREETLLESLQESLKKPKTRTTRTSTTKRAKRTKARR